MLVFLPLGVLSQYLFGPILFVLSLFIIAIILLQRGKGGGLTGALGGLGGQSAFGVKAGDVFTRITAVAVLLWIFTCALACRWYKPEKLDIEADMSSTSSVGPSDAGFGAGFEGFPSAPSPAGESAPTSLPPATPSPATETPAAAPAESGTTPPAAPPADAAPAETAPADSGSVTPPTQQPSEPAPTENKP